MLLSIQLGYGVKINEQEGLNVMKRHCYASTNMLYLGFYFKGVEIEITIPHLGVQFSRPRFGLRKSLHPLINKGHGSLVFLECHCFWNHF
jgi:hypothetical protein